VAKGGMKLMMVKMPELKVDVSELKSESNTFIIINE
jgi:hypothetical protein